MQKRQLVLKTRPNFKGILCKYFGPVLMICLEDFFAYFNSVQSIMSRTNTHPGNGEDGPVGMVMVTVEIKQESFDVCADVQRRQN